MAHTARKRVASHNLSRALAAAVLALLPTVAAAQQGGAVAGVAQDESGAVLPSVTITATNQTTRLIRTTETAADGTFTLDTLPAEGEYIIQAE